MHKTCAENQKAMGNHLDYAERDRMDEERKAKENPMSGGTRAGHDFEQEQHREKEMRVSNVRAVDPYTPMQRAIITVCDDLKNTLLRKNAEYGNSAAEPVQVFTTCDPKVQLYARMNDKLQRIKTAATTGKADPEDAKGDLAGYIMLEKAIDLLAKQDAERAALELARRAKDAEFNKNLYAEQVGRVRAETSV